MAPHQPAEKDMAHRELRLPHVHAVRERTLPAVERRPAAQCGDVHAACALVANHIAVLVGEGRNVLYGLSPQSQGHLWATVDTLVRSAVDNLMTLGIPDGVSGPVARGEMEVVRAHAQALGGESGALYRQLSERLAALLGSMRT